MNDLKICIVFFDPRHKVWDDYSDEIIRNWIFWYKRSGTKLAPVLLTDSYTSIPKSWAYDVVRCKCDSPPFSIYADDISVWIKAQAYESVGRCVLIDVDALLVKNIDDRIEKLRSNIILNFSLDSFLGFPGELYLQGNFKEIVFIFSVENTVGVENIGIIPIIFTIILMG